MENQNTINLTVENPAANNQAVVYVGVSANLDITLSNVTGADLALSTSSILQIFLPFYYDAAQVADMQITDISMQGWTFTNQSSQMALQLAYSSDAGTWANGTSLTFSIQNMLTSHATTSDSLQVNFSGIVGPNVPAQQLTTITLNNPPVVTAVDLPTVLQMNLDNQGAVFVSASTDPLTNTIFLNLSNTSKDPLYTSETLWQGTPQITVSFVYGSTSGALAPADKTESGAVGSAWNISVMAYVDPNGWSVTNPSTTSGANTPTWILKPNSSNIGLIGTGALANETFAFNNIISLTPPGYTQMVLQFTGFMQSETVPYNDCTIVLPIVKQNPPPTRGLINFFSPTFILPISAPTANLSFTVRWGMFYVDQVVLVSNIPGVSIITTNYTNPPALGYDTATITIPGTISTDTPFFLTLQAFDGAGGFLNALQFSVFVSANFFVDRAGNVYPTVYLNKQTWMAKNLNYQTSGAVFYNGNTGYGPTYGMLYSMAAAQASAPAGWRLPTQAEWQGLLDTLGASAYAALINGGTSGFNAQLGGFAIPTGGGQNTFTGMQTSGYYWSGTGNTNPSAPNTTFYTLFSSQPPGVNTINPISNNDFMSVRYVKNS